MTREGREGTGIGHWVLGEAEDRGGGMPWVARRSPPVLRFSIALNPSDAAEPPG